MTLASIIDRRRVYPDLSMLRQCSVTEELKGMGQLDWNNCCLEGEMPVML